MSSRAREALILQAIRSLYDAVLDPEIGPRGFESLCRVVDGKHSLFFTEDTQAHRLRYFTAWGVGPDYARRLSNGVEAKLHSPSTLMLPQGRVKLGQSLWRDQPYRNSAYYNEVVRPDGGYDGLLAVPFHKNRHRAFLVIGRMQGQPDFTEPDASLIQPVISHLTNATQIRLRLEEAEFAARQVHRAFDLLDLGVFVLNAELRPSFMNKYAEDLLRNPDGLFFGRGMLRAQMDRATNTLRRAVKCAIDLQVNRDQSGVAEAGDATLEFEICRPSGRPALIASVMPLGVENSERLLAPLAHAILFVRKPNEKPRFDPAKLVNIFGLSPRRAALAALLAEGATLIDAASALGIALETARWHLRAIFEQTGTHRQVDLVRLVMQTIVASAPTSS